MDFLLIIRGLAALSVVLGHVVSNKADQPAGIELLGRIAVWTFFGISGYVIAHGFIHRRYRLTVADLTMFFRNRILRIYPLFLGLSILGCLTQWATTGVSPIGPSDVPAQLLGLQFNQSYVLSGVFWTLGIELQFYLLAPLLVLPLLSADPRRLWLPIYLMFAFLGTISYGVYAWHGYFLMNVPWTRDQFFALTAMSLCAACLSYRYVEKPALRLKLYPRLDADARQARDKILARDLG